MSNFYSQFDFFDKNFFRDKNKTFFIIDTNAYIYKSYYALHELKNSKGFYINAIFIFFRTILKLFNFIINEKFFDPHVCFAFDVGKETFRTKIFKDYKSNRKKMPLELLEQSKAIKDILKNFKLSCFEMKGYEGDDVIATLSEKILNLEPRSKIFILTYDKDLIQLVNSNIKIFNFPDKLIDNFFVEQKYGFKPKNIVDFLALCGDDIDNIKGIKGIGEKTAKEIIKEYNSIDYILENLDSINIKYKAKILENIDRLKINLELLTIKKDLNLDVDFLNMKFYDIFLEDIFLKVFQKFYDLECFSLIKALKDIWIKVNKKEPYSFNDFIYYDVKKNSKQDKFLLKKINLCNCLIFFSLEQKVLIYDCIKLETFYLPELNFDQNYKNLVNFKIFLDDKKNKEIFLFTDDIKRLFNFLYFFDLDIKDCITFDVLLFNFIKFQKFNIEDLKNSLVLLDRKSFYLKCIDELTKNNLLHIYNSYFDFAKYIFEIEKNCLLIDREYLLLLKENLLKKMLDNVYYIFDKVGFIFDINSEKQFIKILKENFDFGLQKYILNKKILFDIAIKYSNDFPIHYVEYKEILELISNFINPLIFNKKNFIQIFFERGHKNVLGYNPKFNINFSNFFLKDYNSIKKIFISRNDFSFVLIKFKFLALYITNFFMKYEKLNQFLQDKILENKIFEEIFYNFDRNKEIFLNDIFYNVNLDDLVCKFQIKEEDIIELKQKIFNKFPTVLSFYDNFQIEKFKKSIFGNKIILNNENFDKNPLKKFIKCNINEIFKEIITFFYKDKTIKDCKILYFDNESEILFECLDQNLKYFLISIEKILKDMFKFYIPIQFHIEIGKNYGEMKKINKL